MLDAIRAYVEYAAGKPETEEWSADELAHTERNADAFRAALGQYA